MKNSPMSQCCNWLRISFGRAPLVIAVTAVVLALLGAMGPVSAAPSRSTTIALTSDETRVVVVNREANSVSIICVKNANGQDVAVKIAEIGVGEEPSCVAVSPNDRFAFVTNGINRGVRLLSTVVD
jgi:DNA-binding beta-propeller fold protein YncE